MTPQRVLSSMTAKKTTHKFGPSTY